MEEVVYELAGEQGAAEAAATEVAFVVEQPAALPAPAGEVAAAAPASGALRDVVPWSLAVCAVMVATVGVAEFAATAARHALLALAFAAVAAPPALARRRRLAQAAPRARA